MSNGGSFFFADVSFDETGEIAPCDLYFWGASSGCLRLHKYCAQYGEPKDNSADPTTG